MSETENRTSCLTTFSQTITVSSCHVEGGGGAWSWSRCEPPPSYMWGVGGPPGGGDGGPTLSLFRDKRSFLDRFAARMRQTMVLPVAPLGRYLSNPPKDRLTPPPPPTDAFEGKGPQRRPRRRLDRRLEEVTKAVGGGYCYKCR